MSVRDAAGHDWRVKWGQEVHTETFGTRLAWALGYFAEPTYFLASGTIEGTRDLRRARACIDAEQRFTDARFELSEPDVETAFRRARLGVARQPVRRDARAERLEDPDDADVELGQQGRPRRRRADRTPPSSSIRVDHGRREARYLIIDWGAALGAWGNNVLQRGRWDPEAFAGQNAQFVTGVDGDLVQFGYQGQRTVDLTANITRADVALVRRASRTASPTITCERRCARAARLREEVDLFTAALRARLDQLRDAAAPTAP